MHMPLTKCTGLALFGVLLVAIGLRASHLGDDCFDCDELYAVRLNGISPQIIASVMVRDGFHTNHPPLMTVPFLPWTAVFGTSEVAVRSLPCLAGILAVIAVFAFCWLTGHPKAGVFAAAILAINPLHITYSSEARQYALVVALLATAHVLFVAVLQTNRRSLVLAYYLVAAWAALTHYFAVPVLLGHTITALWFARNVERIREPASRLVLALILAGLPYLAWLPVIHFQSQHKWDHLAPLTVSGLIDSLLDLIGVGCWGSVVGQILALLAIGLLVVGMWAVWEQSLLVTGSRCQHLIPNGLGWLFIASGVLGGLAFAVAFPRFIQPVAQKTLSNYGYDASTIENELILLKQTGLLSLGCLVVGGLMLLAWPSIEKKLTPREKQENATDQCSSRPRLGTLLSVLLVVPLLVIGLAGLTGLPFHQTRNLLVLLPVISITWGLAFEKLSHSTVGLGIVIFSVGGAIASATQYHAVARAFGGNGLQLGMATVDWRGVEQWLTRHTVTDRVIVLMNRPATDPGLYYLAAFQPVRITPDAEPPSLPQRIIYIHLTGNLLSERTRDRLIAQRPLELLATGEGWELYASPKS
jgi:hypothetical protein